MNIKFALVTLTLVLPLVIGCEKDGDTKTSKSTPDDPLDTALDNPDSASTERVKTDKEALLQDMPEVPICRKTCGSPADCVEGGADALHDADNYACEKGLCLYTGCTSDAECATTYPGMGYKCNPNGGCLPECSTPADCVAFSAADADEDNYSCDQGVCLELGCQNDNECEREYGSTWSCQDPMNTGKPSCGPKCDDGANGADCVQVMDNPAYTGDHYECLLKKCYYMGCRSDEECGDGQKCAKI